MSAQACGWTSYELVQLQTMSQVAKELGKRYHSWSWRSGRFFVQLEDSQLGH